MEGEGAGLKLALTDSMLAVLETRKVTRQIIREWFGIRSIKF